jgi:hypothetical protein
MNETILKGEDLIAKKEILKKIATDESGWNIYFVDKDSNRWIQEYSGSEYHGGGQPQLKMIEKFPWEQNQNYKLDFFIVRNIINDFDPCALMQSGGQDDEYDSISNKVLSFVYNKKSFDLTINDIYKELINNFGLELLQSNEKILKDEIKNVLINVLIHLSKHSS